MGIKESEFKQNYTSEMSQLYQNTCHNGHRLICQLFEKFTYESVDFSNLPIIYTVKQNKGVNSHLPTKYTLTMYGLWYQKQSLIECLKEEINKDMCSMVSDDIGSMFKLKVLPQNIMKSDTMRDINYDIMDDQEYNDITLTTFRKFIQLKNNTQCQYDSV